MKESPEFLERLEDSLVFISGGAFLSASIVSLTGEVGTFRTIFCAVSIAAGGAGIVKGALSSVRNLRIDMNLLMFIAVAGALFLKDYLEAAAVVFLFATAELLEEKSVSKAKAAIRKLISLKPSNVRLKRNGEEISAEPRSVKPGETIIVHPFEVIPLDGKVLKGESEVDLSILTGESMPIAKMPGDSVPAGAINGSGALEILVESCFEDSTPNRIMKMVEKTARTRAPVERFIDRFAAVYTPLVVLAAIALVIVPVLFFEMPFDTWFYMGLVLLVIACPCALVISTPVAVISALTSGARKGILFKESRVLEAISRVSTVAFDKTGTLTEGRPEVREIRSFGALSEEELLCAGASIESRVPHPAARAIVKKAEEKKIGLMDVEMLKTVPGKGAEGIIKGRKWFIGSMRYIEEQGAVLPGNNSGEGASIEVYIGSGAVVEGSFILSDSIRKQTRPALRELRDKGVGCIVLLTGDGKKAAESAAREIGIDDVRAELSPEQKAGAILQMQIRESGGGTVLMVGDGINDAPALKAADIGMAMSTGGNDIAIETADAALLVPDISLAPKAISLGKKTIARIKENIAFSIAIKFLFLFLAVAGYSTLWMAIAADMGTSLLVILNSMRLRSG